MEDFKKFIKNIWHLLLSSLASLLVYFPLAFVLKAAQNDRIEDGSFFWAPVIIFMVTELCYLAILWYVRFHNNDDLEKDFMKEYRDIPWQGMKADFPRALKSEIFSYLLVYAVAIISCGTAMMNISNPLAVVLFPVTMMQTAMHPILGCIVGLIIFTAGYTLIVCFVREKLATAVKSNTVKSVAGTKAYISFTRNRR